MAFLDTFILFRPAAAFVLLSFAFRLPFVLLSLCFRSRERNEKAFRFRPKIAQKRKVLSFPKRKAFSFPLFVCARLDFGTASACASVMRAYNQPPDAWRSQFRQPPEVRRWAASARGGRSLAARPPSTRPLATSRSLASDQSTNQRSEHG